MTQPELFPPSYANANASATSVPSYTASTITQLPTKFPVTLTVHNTDKLHAHVSLTLDEFLVAQLSLSREDDAQEFTSQAKLVIASTHAVPFAVRRHVPSSNYEIISLDAEGAHGRCRKLTTKSLLFKNKYYVEGLNGKQWAWKGNLNRTLSLYQYPEIEGSEKKLLAEYIRSTTGPAKLHIDAIPSEEEPNEAFALIFASLYALVDMHRTVLATHFTTEEDLQKLQREVKPSAWDTAFLSAGQGSAKQEKFKAQLQKERERERSQSRTRESVTAGGFIPAADFSNSSRDQSPAGLARKRM